MSIQRPIWLIAGVLCLAIVSRSVSAATMACCPFCSAVAQTFTEEMNSMDAVVIAELLHRPPEEKDPQPGDDVGRATFRVVEVLKGGELIKTGEKFETLYFGDAALGTKFIVMAVDPNKLLWSTPLVISERALDYFHKLQKLPAEGVERLEFFQNYLEDSEDILARDAYDEFAKAPYDLVQQLKPKIKHDQLLAWIKDTENVPASRRRLYLTMIGVSGTKDDLPFLEETLTHSDKKQRAGLDALVACYLTLKGDDGVKLVEDQFLKNKDADYAETYATIMALRFHATESDVVSKKRIVEALRCMLDRPELADLVIPDLARLEDWESADRLMELYRQADEKSSWVRVPIINYLRACPDKEKSKEMLAECEKIDPMSVKRANTFFPFGAKKEEAPKSSQAEPAGDSANLVRHVVATEPIVSDTTSVANAQAATGTNQAESSVADENAEAPLASANLGVTRAAAAIDRESAPLPWSILLGVPCFLGCALAFIQWRILCTAGR